MTDNADVPPPRRGRGCLFWFFVLVFGLPVGLIGLVLLLLGTRDMSAQRRFQERVAALRSAGKPVDAASMRLYHSEIASEEDAQAWIDLLASLQSEEFRADCKDIPILGVSDETEFPKHGEKWSDEAAVRAFLEKWSGLHDRAMRLSMKSKPVKFPIDWDGLGTLLPQTQEMRSAARLLQLRGRLAIYDRDAAGVRRCIDAMLGCATVLEAEPCFVSQLVFVAIDQMAVRVLKDAVEEDILREEDLRYLTKRILPGTKLGDHWSLALNGERGMVLPIFQDPSSVSEYVGGGNEVATRLPFRGKDANAYLDIIERALDADTSTLDAFCLDVAASEAELSEQRYNSNVFQQMETVLTGMLTPAIQAAGSAFVRRAMNHRLAVLAMSVRLHEMESGSFPASITDVKFEGIASNDLMPPGGKPFGYETDRQSAYLWGFSISRGENTVPAQRPIIAPDEPYADDKRDNIWKLTDREE